MPVVFTDEKQTCEKCGRTRNLKTDFFNLKDGTKDTICKECLNLHIVNDQPETFLPILQRYDVPYIEKIWVSTVNKIYKKNPGKWIDPAHTKMLGIYLRQMNMTQYKPYHFEDSQRLNFEFASSAEIEMRQENTKIKQDVNYCPPAPTLTDIIVEDTSPSALLDSSIEISESIKLPNQDTSYITNWSETRPDSPPPDMENFISSRPVGFIDPIVINEDTISNMLTTEDAKYLALKWGTLYKPSQWVKLEELYNQYASEYDLNTDREETLKKICRTSLKMDEALDAGDVVDFKALSAVFDQLRRSGRFTDAQKKEEKKRELDTIGELVAFVEREGGIIPQFENSLEYPEDKIDFCIKDMQNYLNHLVRDELGLGELIESYIKKLDEQKTQSIDDILNTNFDDESTLTEEEQEEYMQFRLDEIEEEALRLANGDNVMALLDEFQDEYNEEEDSRLGGDANES